MSLYRNRLTNSVLTAPASPSSQLPASPMCLHMGCFGTGFACCKPGAPSLSKLNFSTDFGIFRAKAIEPSEIFVDGKGIFREQTTTVAPWTRFWARLFDYALFCCLLWMVRQTTGLSFRIDEMFVPIEYLLWVPVEAVLLMTVGITPGKWVLRTKIQQGRHRRFEPKAAWKRSFNVWLRGIGLGIPVLNFICMLVSYQHLLVRKISSWDLRDHIHITHHKISPVRLRIVGVLAAAGLVLYHFYGR